MEAATVAEGRRCSLIILMASRVAGVKKERRQDRVGVDRVESSGQKSRLRV